MLQMLLEVGANLHATGGHTAGSQNSRIEKLTYGW